MVAEQLSEYRSPGWISVSPCSAGPALVVVVGGEADWVTAGQLQDDVAAALAYGPRSLVLDLTEVEFCNLHGLRALMAAVDRAEQAGVDVTMRGMSRQLTWLHDRVTARRASYGQRSRASSFSPGSGSPLAAVRVVPFV